MGPGLGPARARPDLSFLGADPFIGDGSGPRPAWAWPRARGHEPGPVYLGPDPSLLIMKSDK